MDQFAVEVVRLSDPALLRIRGELDLATKAGLLAALEPLWEDGAGTVELDMHDVSFIDSSVISALVHLHRKGKDTGRRLVVRNPSGPVARVLEVSGVDLLIEIVRDEGPAD